MLARSGNIAVTHLDGRAFPGIHIQADTFAEFVHQLERVRDDPAELDDLLSELSHILDFYETTIASRGLRLPYQR